MASSDLPLDSSAQPVVVVGSTTAGVTTTPLAVGSDGSAQVKDLADGTPGSAVPATAIQVAGSDGTNLRTIKTATDGTVKVDGSAVTQPVSAASLPLPTGASTETTLSTLNTKVVTVNSQVQVRDTINTAGQNRAQSVTTTAAEALGAATILTNRKLLVVTPTNGTVYWGYTNAVTTSSGTPIFKNMPAVFAITDNVHIYLISAGTVDCRIAEAS